MAAMIRLIDLYRVVGRRLTRKLIEANWIAPVRSGARGLLRCAWLVVEQRDVHLALRRLQREGATLGPRYLPVPPKPKKPLLLDENALQEALARLSEIASQVERPVRDSQGHAARDQCMIIETPLCPPKSPASIAAAKMGVSKQAVNQELARLQQRKKIAKVCGEEVLQLIALPQLFTFVSAGPMTFSLIEAINSSKLSYSYVFSTTDL
jgi:hypothetical protein